MTVPGFGSAKSPGHQVQSPVPGVRAVVASSPSGVRTTQRPDAEPAFAQDAHQDPAGSTPPRSALDTRHARNDTHVDGVSHGSAVCAASVDLVAMYAGRRLRFDAHEDRDRPSMIHSGGP